MYLARIEGSAVSTLHHPSLAGRKLLIARRTEPDGRLAAEPVLILDDVGAGLGDLVLVSTDGRLACGLTGHKTAPVRLTAVGIVDAVTTASRPSRPAPTPRALRPTKGGTPRGGRP